VVASLVHCSRFKWSPHVTVTIISSGEINRHTSRSKKAARRGPVIITNRGRPAQVLLSIEQYHALTGSGSTESIVDLLAMPGTQCTRFNPPRLSKPAKPADLR
jgi:antitoxin (DNA-binding transcriptional repressor) of toxin-antitoxin stability system